MVFAIHWHESAMDLHVFSIPIPPPTSLPIPSLWVFLVHQPWALVSCIQPGLVICFTLGSILVSMLLLYLFSRSVVSDSAATPWTAAHQASLSFTISQSLLKLMFIESVMPSNHLILCHPLLLPSVFSQHQGLSWVSSSYQVTKVLELQLQYQSLQWIFRTDFL